jgi:tetratricopeptide (TPR) repeat protein
MKKGLLVVWSVLLLGCGSGDLKKIETAEKLMIEAGRLEKTNGREAVLKYQQAVDLFREAKDVEGEAMALNNLGMFYVGKDDWQPAAHYIGEALRRAEKDADAELTAQFKCNLGLVRSKTGEPQKAIDLLHGGLSFFEGTRNQAKQGEIFELLGNVYRETGRHDDALDAYRRALDHRQAAGDKGGQGIAYMGIGLVSQMKNDQAEAYDAMNRASAIFRELQDRRQLGTTVQFLGVIESERNEIEAARKHLTEAAALYAEVGDPSLEAQAWLILGSQQAKWNEWEAAEETIGRALVLAKVTGNKEAEAKATAALGNVLIWKGIEDGLKGKKKAAKPNPKPENRRRVRV